MKTLQQAALLGLLALPLPLLGEISNPYADQFYQRIWSELDLIIL
jgi:hypothetical protein